MAELKTWDERFTELKKYKKKYKHCNVSRRDGSLGSWVSIQRSAYNNKKLTEEKIKKLESMGFVWEIDNALRTKRWDEMFAELKKYKKKYKHCNVARRDGSLGAWVSTQRTTYKQNKLSQEKIDLLESIGFVWKLL